MFECPCRPAPFNNDPVESQPSPVRVLVVDDEAVIRTYVDRVLRDAGYAFAQIGNFVERADNTARILDVKYHLLLPANERVGGPLDYFQW